MPIRTKPYTVTRPELVLLGVREYLRSFWWFMLITPLFGLVAVILGSGLLQIIGMMAIVWPFSLPARSVITSARPARLFGKGCRLEADEQEIVFYGAENAPKALRFKLPLEDIRSVGQLNDLLVIRTRRFGAVPVRENAFESDEDRGHFLALIEAAIERRLA